MTDAIHPTIDPSAYLCHGSVLIGQVTVEAKCFVGPNAVLRGDIEPIIMEEGSNIQDNCVLHTHRGNPTRIGRNTSLGHGAIVHGATIEANCLIGMNAVILDNAVIGEGSVVGAGAVVKEGMIVPPGSLVVGLPAKIVKENDDRIREMATKNGENYQRYLAEHQAGKWGTVLGGQ